MNMESPGSNGRLTNVIDDDSQSAGSGLHISDVIDVIQMDTEQNNMNPTGANMSEGQPLPEETAEIVILEQPASKALRFRYECEGRSAGSIPGINSTPENKSFPTIQVKNYQGKAAVIVSCVTKDAPYRPHPHNLVGKEGCKRGVFSQHVASKNMVVSFSNLGIQCVKKKDIEEALRVREEIRVDPFRTGFAHRSNPIGIDLNAVRLCFQVFLEGPTENVYTRALTPVVSEPIYDKKAMSDLVICKLSDASASVAGGREMILLCEKVAKEDIQIRFYEESDSHLKWEAYADFQPSQVHKQVAISFRTPRYETLEIDSPVHVLVQLRRPSDGAISESHPFVLTPLDADPVGYKRKRQKYSADDPSSSSIRHFQEHAKSRYLGSSSPEKKLCLKNEPPLHLIKTEPSDASQMYYNALSPLYAGGGMHSVATPQAAAMGRTPSPAEASYQAHSPYGMGEAASPYGMEAPSPYAMAVAASPVYSGYPQQPYAAPPPPGQQAPFMPAQGMGMAPSPGVTLPNPNVRSTLLAGGSCTAAPNFSPDPARPGPSGMPAPHHVYSGLVDPVNPVVGNLAMGMPPSPADYPAHSNSSPGSSPSDLPFPAYVSVDPVVPVANPFELRELSLNSGDLSSLGPIGSGEGALSEQMLSNLSLTEPGHACS